MARIGKTIIKKLQKELRTDSRIGDRLGVTRQKIWRLRQEYGIPRSRKH